MANLLEYEGERGKMDIVTAPLQIMGNIDQGDAGTGRWRHDAHSSTTG